MYGAIIGDICGSAYEWYNMKTVHPYDIPLDKQGSDFTDDTVLTIAIAEACLGDRDYANAQQWGASPDIYEPRENDFDAMVDSTFDSTMIISKDYYFALSLGNRIRSIKAVNRTLKIMHISVLKWGQLHGLIPPDNYKDTVSEESALGKYLINIGLMKPGGGAAVAELLTNLAHVHLSPAGVINVPTVWIVEAASAKMTIGDTLDFAFLSWSKSRQFDKVTEKINVEKNKAHYFYDSQQEQYDWKIKLSEKWIFP